MQFGKRRSVVKNIFKKKESDENMCSIVSHSVMRNSWNDEHTEVQKAERRVEFIVVVFDFSAVRIYLRALPPETWIRHRIVTLVLFVNSQSENSFNMIENVGERKWGKTLNKIELNHESACKINIRWGKVGLESLPRLTIICIIEMIICCFWTVTEPANEETLFESKLAVSDKLHTFFLAFATIFCVRT